MSENIIASLNQIKPSQTTLGLNLKVDDTSKQASSVVAKSPFPGYEVFEKLGQGGMGSVYRCRQINMDRIVAIKVLRSQYSSQPKIVEKFLKEAKILASLNHNNIIKVITLGQHQNRYYFVMEYVNGNTLLEKLAKEVVLKEKEVLEIAIQISSAISHLNQLGIVHRDIKPSNIILNSQGIPKLSDFGISVAQNIGASNATTLTGTCHYISPEQALEKEVDIRSDIYSFGATLFHLLTGQTPFSGEQSYVIITKHLTEEICNPQKLNPLLSKGVSALILKMMAKKPENRIQNAEELLSSLKAVLDTGMMPNSLKTRAISSGKTSRRMRNSKSFYRRNLKV